MQSRAWTVGAIRMRRRLLGVAAGFGFIMLFVFASTALAQGETTTPLSFGNNYFVTGDYVVGGVGLRGLGVNGYATGTIMIPDPNSVPATGVPAGADVVGAFLYWVTVESSKTESAGQNGFFRGYPIQGVRLGNPNAPVSWSSGGCSGDSKGSKTMRAYRADVLALLPVDSDPSSPTFESVLPNNSYEVRLADSGSKGGGDPLTLGATLVIIYRVLDLNAPLKSVIIYDGAYSPSNGSTTMIQPLQGFYQAAASPVSKLTHIVGNGQTNKFEDVYLNGQWLPSLYAGKPSFPGHYNESWDNPTWSFSPNGNPVQANDASATTMVVPTGSNKGCVSWGAVILSTSVRDDDKDGLLNVWEQNQGYCDASVAGGVCNPGDPSWVALPGAVLGQKDVFVQMDSTCSIVNPNGTCDTTSGVSFLPPADALTMTTNAFSARGINLHLIPTNVIPEQSCTDDYSTSPPSLCSFPGQSGVVGWKGGFAFLKNQPLNYPDEDSCVAAASGPCLRRFQHGRKDSYHYVITARALGTAHWGFQGGSLVSVVVSNNGVATFTTKDPTDLVVSPVDSKGRVTVADAITSPNLNGVYLVTSVSNAPPYSFTIQTTNVAAGTYNLSTDPDLAVASGKVGTGSGVSDVGGGDSLITLGLWGADATTNVQAGTFMHELGHSLALTHGGFFLDPQNGLVAKVGPNCKPNFQSVMNYLFQVDLLDNGILDYSGETLIDLNESGSGSGITKNDGSATAYSTTKWYTSLKPSGNPKAATRHCDGTPLLPTDPEMFRVEGPTTSVVWNNQDLNFDGQIPVNSSLLGYEDWANINLQQMGATGSLSTVGGITRGGTGITRGGTGITRGGTGITRGGTGITKGGTGITRGGTGIGNGELTHQQANSVTRPPRTLAATRTDTRTLHKIVLSWDPPTFGQVTFNVYRNGATITTGLSGTTTSYTDDVTALPGCTTYTYFVSSVLESADPELNGNESVPSNSVEYSVPCPPTGLTATLTVTNGVGSIGLNWTAASTASGAIGQYKIYRDDGSGSGVVLLNTVGSETTSYVDQPVVNHTTITYYVTAASEVLNDLQACPAGQNCRESSAASTTISVDWMVDSETTITGIVPSPSILGQPVTVSVTVSPAFGAPPPTPTGTVTVSDSGKTICTITLSGGSGSCTGTPSLLIGGLPAVGTRAITATYNGDLNFNGSAASRNQQVFYAFTGFDTPMSPAGTLSEPSLSSSQKYGSAIPLKFALADFNGNLISDVSAVSSIVAIPKESCSGPVPAGPVYILYNPTTGATGGSTFRFGTTGFIFNWDTSSVPPLGCYAVVVQPNDGSPAKVTYVPLR